MAPRVYRIGGITSTNDPKEKSDRIDKRSGRVTKARKGKKGLLPISPATWWRWIAAGHAPAGFRLGANTTVWDADAVEAFIAKQAGGQ